MADSYVLVIGAAISDTKGRVNKKLVQSTSNPGAIRICTGGVAHNVAENLARLGADTILFSAVGDDRSGKRIVSQSKEAGIDVSHILCVRGVHSGAYMALLDEDGNLIASIDDIKVLEALTARAIYQRRSLVRDAEMIFFDANLSPAAIKTLVGLAEKYNVPVCADPTSTSLAGRLKPYLSKLLMIAPNVNEAEILSGQKINNLYDASAAAKKLVNQGVKVAIITLAEMGVAYATADQSGHVPAIKADIVDQTGASDALTATIIFGLTNDFSIDEAVRLGSSAAALTLQSEESVCPDLSLERLYDKLII